MAERASAAAVRAADADAAAPRPFAAAEPVEPESVTPEQAAPEPVTPTGPPITTKFVAVPIAEVEASTPPARFNGAAPPHPDPFDERITAFRQRAEKVMIRLQEIEAGGTRGEPSEVVRLR